MAERLVLLQLFLEEDEDLLLLMIDQLIRNETQPMYLARDAEGFQNILIQRHLLKDESVFRKFFRLNIEQFNYVLSLIEHDLMGQSCGLVKKPISPAEKLGLTLRQVPFTNKVMVRLCKFYLGR